MRVLLTGAGGFVGHHCLEYFLKCTDWEILCLDSFRHKGTYRRLIETNYDPARVSVFRHDLTVPIDRQLENLLLDRRIVNGEIQERPIDYVMNLASNSAVERSTSNPVECLRNNSELIINTLEFARALPNLKLFLHMSCYDEETRALTPEGFKTYDELRVGDEILTLNPETRQLEMKPIEKVIVQEYSGEMYHFNYGRVNLKVTPNHRVLCQTDDGISVTTAEEIREEYYLPSGIWSGKTDIDVDLSRLGLNSTEELFYCCGVHLADSYLPNSSNWDEFFKEFGSGVNQHIPDWMLQFDRQHLQKLLFGMTGGTSVFSTKSVILVRDCCEIGIKLGLFPYFEQQSSSYIVHFSKVPPVVSPNHLKIKQYQGRIWCCKVKDNRNLIVERDGKICICGNTDEVYGEAGPHGAHKEWDVICPSNPYAGSKAGQEALAISYFRTYNLPVVIVNAMNIVGERQDPEKFLPKIIQKVAQGQEMPIYGDPQNIGSRIYLHAQNLTDALIFLANRRPALYSDFVESQQTYLARPDRYNVCGDVELNNLELAQMVAEIMGKELKYRFVSSESARPGYDRRYALDGSKLAGLGWQAPLSVRESVEQIVQWTLQNPHWLV